MTISFITLASMQQLRELLAGKPVDTPHKALTIIDIVLRQLAAQRCIADLQLFYFFSFMFLFYFQLRLLILDFQLLVCGCLSYVSVGRFLYSSDIKKPQQLGGGLESWRGFYQSIRPIQMGLSLNIGGYSSNPLGCFVFIEMLLHNNLSPKVNILHFFPLLLMIQTCHRLRSLNHSLSLILLLRF